MLTIHLKLDELIRNSKSGRNTIVDLEKLSDKELEKLRDEFRRVRDKKSTSSIKES